MSKSAPSESHVRAYYETHRERYERAINVEQIFTSTKMPDEFNPAIMKLPREACDSIDSPLSRGFIYANDFTGSMGRFSLELVKSVFPRLIRITNKIATNYNPHIMFMGIGDVTEGDEAPLQVTQFEVDLRMLQQLERLWIEGHGGSNSYESYILPWYFAAKHIEMDCYNKRGEKGFLFTFGDEEPTPRLRKSEIMTVFGNRDTIDSPYLTDIDCLEMAEKKFNCYHIILPGNYFRRYSDSTISKWRELMGNHVCYLSEFERLPELVSTIQMMYDGKTKTQAIDESIKNLIEERIASGDSRKDAERFIKYKNVRQVLTEALKWHEENVIQTSNNFTDADIEQF